MDIFQKSMKMIIKLRFQFFNMKRSIIFFITFLLFDCLPASAQSFGETIKNRLGFSKPAIPAEARTNLLAGNLQEALLEYSQAVAQAHQTRNETRGVEGELMAEYAYTLALHHDFEAALMYIDRARMVGAKHGDFYAAQILTLMGYTEPAKQMMTNTDIPDWIANSYQNLTQTHTTSISINRDIPQDAMKRANRLAANKQTVQSIALFEELIKFHPNAYMLYIDYSTVWESLGKNDYAASLLDKGINLMPFEMIDSESRKAFINHLSEIKNTESHTEDMAWLKNTIGSESPRLMTYVGATAMKKTFLMNGRMGIYTSNKYSASLNLGFGFVSGNFTGNIGISAYKNWGVFFAGLGISDQFSKGSNTFGLSPSLGLSFLDQSQSSSIDITLGGFVPLFSESRFSYSISIGKTIYIDLKGVKK